MKPTDCNVIQLRNNSLQETNDLLMDSAGHVSLLLKLHGPMEALAKHPVLVMAHALLQKVDFLGERIADAAENIAESADWVAAHSDGDDADTAWRRLDFMIANWKREHPNHSADELNAVAADLAQGADHPRQRTQIDATVEALESLTEQERWLAYEALKAGFVRAKPEATPKEYDRAMLLYSNLLWL